MTLNRKVIKKKSVNPPREGKERDNFVIVVWFDKPNGTSIGFFIVSTELVESMPTIAQVLERIVEPNRRIDGQIFT